MRRAILLSLVVLALVPSVARAELPPPPWGDGRSDPEALRVYLVTFGPGDDVASLFGHSSLVVEDVQRRQSYLYNYGMFSFGASMWPRFLMGRLTFWVGDAPTGGSLSFYRSQNRDIRVQTLNLDPAARLLIARHLADNVLPENRDYLYHHYNDNCATRVRDAIDLAVGGQLRRATTRPDELTLREHTRRYTGAMVPLEILLMFWMNSEIDRPITRWDAMFLPDELEKEVGKLTYIDSNGRRVPLVAEQRVIYAAHDRTSTPDVPPERWPVLLLIGALWGLSAIGLEWWRRARNARMPRVLAAINHVLVGLLLGLPGLALFAMAGFTEHTVTYGNQNLLLANPLTAAALVAAWGIGRGRGRTRRWMGALWVVLAITGVMALVLSWLPWFDQDTSYALALILPVNLGFAGAAVWPEPSRHD